ncbi:amidohydrolase family protein [Comamonas testosteroni]|uniref:N-acyl-D-amino-acid deacylase family protein n=1 Tax=Comamonas testosteroni TaxID=285 RepID=UPI00389A484F
MQQFDLLIRNGRIVDGTGAPIYRADLGIRNGRIAAIGRQLGDAAQQIDAEGLLVTPGFVDLHTHFDGQATWDERLWPSSQQGVTTAVMGNCGVGFAPCRPEARDQLIALMEGVEDIPDTALHEGLPWNWESFPEYLQALAARRYDIDIAALLPHAPLRVHAMGERAIRREQASAEDIKAMQELIRQGLAAGAVGLSTSRTMAHRSRSGDFTPMYQAASEELLALGVALKNYPNSVFQMISDFEHVGDEFSILTRVAQRTGRAATLTVLQYPHRPQLHRELLQQIEKANADGLRIMGQVLNRPVGVLMGFECSLNPFSCRPSYAALAPLEPAERLRALALPTTRSAILDEKDRNPHLFMEYFGQNFSGMYPLVRRRTQLSAAGRRFGSGAGRCRRRTAAGVDVRLHAGA